MWSAVITRLAGQLAARGADEASAVCAATAPPSVGVKGWYRAQVVEQRGCDTNWRERVCVLHTAGACRTAPPAAARPSLTIIIQCRALASEALKRGISAADLSPCRAVCAAAWGQKGSRLQRQFGFGPTARSHLRWQILEKERNQRDDDTLVDETGLVISLVPMRSGSGSQPPGRPSPTRPRGSRSTTSPLGPAAAVRANSRRGQRAAGPARA